uniref:Thiamine-phosphate synthase n=1 Tax=Thermosporothrix sp. COM3 TaxID=2490863 RepID=A0A455SM22_9CHLR|nr:thiamine-phosphate synthase [Thermosporothrix sp. COM3]
MNRAALAHRLTLHVLTDREWSRGRDTVSVARAALEGGATVIQLRDKLASTRELIEQGQALRELTRAYNALLIVNDRVDVAVAVDADGAHVGQDDMPAPLARQILGPQRILGVSAGTLDEALGAIKDGADYLGVGPIFATRGKLDAGPAIGAKLISTLAARFPTPLVAIGGLTATNAPEIIRAGAAGIAVITAVVAADDITAATRELLTTIQAAKQSPQAHP